MLQTSDVLRVDVLEAKISSLEGEWEFRVLVPLVITGIRREQISLRSLCVASPAESNAMRRPSGSSSTTAIEP